MKILITGGAGYVGSTIASACSERGFEALIVDDLSTGFRVFTRGHQFYEGDLADGDLIDQIFADHPDIHGVIHCGAKISVSDSVVAPLEYYKNNVVKSVELVTHLLRNGCRRLIFSSSASVYALDQGGADESAPVRGQSPYARTKLACEQMMADVAAAHPIAVMSLRYFNPIGADPAMRSGPHDPHPTSVLGKLVQAHRDAGPFEIYGVDWPTRDGTAVRDFIHVWDLAGAHVRALEMFDTVFRTGTGFEVINLGTGTGTTIRELVTAFGQVVGPVDVRETARRPGDIAGGHAVTGKARELLEWQPVKALADGLRDAAAWDGIRRRIIGQDENIGRAWPQ